MNTAYFDGRVAIYHTHVLDFLRFLPERSVHMCCTSPPYWGLRDYKLTPTVWGGDPACAHEWGQEIVKNNPQGPHLNAGFRERNPNGGGGRQPQDQPVTIVQGTFCPCGAWRGGLGLEPTPELYVEHLVEVFREVRRVLRDDGTLWLNLGDTYAAAPHGHGDTHDPKWPDGRDRSVELSAAGPRIGHRSSFRRDRKAREDTQHKAAPPLKPKDLCMIPARVALALQQPYYSGRIKNESDRRWLAAIIDGEGCIYISRSKEGALTGRGRRSHRTQDAFDVGVKITNTNTQLLEAVRAVCGYGRLRLSAANARPAYDVTLYSSRARELLREVYPYLIAKQHEARLAIGCPPSGAAATAAHKALKTLHRGGATTVDFPPPPSLYEPGWYLRSDVIWSKTNPMPEAVTDRPTKSHEYLFLLSKSEHYFYDGEAIKETVTGGAHARGDGVNPKATAWKTPDGWDTSSDNGGHGRVHRAGREDGHTGYQHKRRPKQNASFSAAVNDLVTSRNKRDVWTIATEAFPGAHFATFPQALIKPTVLAGTSERGACPECGAPWKRILVVGYANPGDRTTNGPRSAERTHQEYGTAGYAVRLERRATTVGWRPPCRCYDQHYRADFLRARRQRKRWQRERSGDWWRRVRRQPGRAEWPTVSCVVLDSFSGAGTTMLVAKELGRRGVAADLSAEYIALSADRLRQDVLPFTQESPGESTWEPGRGGPEPDHDTPPRAPRRR